MIVYCTNRCGEYWPEWRYDPETADYIYIENDRPRWSMLDIQTVSMYKDHDINICVTAADDSCIILRPYETWCNSIYYNGTTHYIRELQDLYDVYEELLVLLHNEEVEKVLAAV